MGKFMITRMKKLYVLLLVIAVPTIGYAVSFDCNKAKTFVEQTICSNVELSSLDDQLAVRYKEAIRIIDNKESLKVDQRKWLTIRNNCKDIECLKEVYVKRISDLDRYTNFIEIARQQTTQSAQSQVMTFDELRKLIDEQAKAYGTVVTPEHGLEYRKLFRTGEAYEGKIVLLAGERFITDHQYKLEYLHEPDQRTAFHVRGVDPKSEVRKFDDRFVLIGAWQRVRSPFRNDSWGINTYWICGMLTDEKAKKAEVLCETMKKP